MRLKQTVLRVMGRDVLKKAVTDLGIDDVDRRSVQEMGARLSRSRRATAEYLLQFLSERDVKCVCDLLGINASGRRRTLVSNLLAAAGRSPASARKAVLQREPPKAKSTLYTIGYSAIPDPKEMTKVLREHGVDVLVDVRISARSRIPAFNKGRLEDPREPIKSSGLGYLHIVELGNATRGMAMTRLKNEAKGLARLSDEMKRGVVAIMCQCPDAGQCHRSHVAERMTERMPGLRVEHL